ncbi:MAG: hypothetical protein LBP52_05930 [Burkholderiaceae bacterium]|nr:hypothetical protein [Burkholderiaceae bacterium]
MLFSHAANPFVAFDAHCLVTPGFLDSGLRLRRQCGGQRAVILLENPCPAFFEVTASAFGQWAASLRAGWQGEIIRHLFEFEREDGIDERYPATH